VDDTGEVLAEHLAQLALDLALYEHLNNRDRVECAVDIDALEWIRLEYQRNSFLFGDNEHNIRAELEVR
jgi:hypothetical protein